MTERRAVYNASPLEDEFALQLQIASIPFEREYRAINGRKYRWDFLVGSILVEIQGGTWTKGGHSTGKGLHRDYEKNNAAVLAGWRVLYFDAEMVRSGAALGTVQDMMTGRVQPWVKKACEVAESKIEIESTFPASHPRSSSFCFTSAPSLRKFPRSKRNLARSSGVMLANNAEFST